jgi:Na+/H+ antiporter NhaD/arsenite permease-like protein
MQTRVMGRVGLFAFFAFITTTHSAFAASLDGAALSWPWGIPFVGLLLTIATGPLLFPNIWHAHYGKITVFWSVLALAPIALMYGVADAAATFVHAMLAEYSSFIVLLFVLYTVAGGILVKGQIKGTPINNTLMLALGAVMASFIGTTGAAMILVRSVIRANEQRQHKTHIIVFFIILVANVGGALTPLGDPPLFVGFLHGVDFLWPLKNLWLQTSIVVVLVLALFFVSDHLLFRRDRAAGISIAASTKIQVNGMVNVVLIALIIAAIILSALWKPGVQVSIAGTSVELQNLVRDIVLVGIALLSLWLTPDEHRVANGFTWEPIREVAKLFAGIFVAITPVVAMLQAGRNGPFLFVLTAVMAEDGLPHEAAYFWLTGVLSAFLDNAPTYLVFFELAGGDPIQLMGPLAGTLAAISMGAVYMGALSYIGNAPNFMVYAIAQENGIRMPGFFGYLFYASLILLPLFLLLTLLPIAPALRLG